MGHGLVTSTQASRQENTLGTIRVETKNPKNARKYCGKSAARSMEVHARSADQTHSPPPTAATAAAIPGGVRPNHEALGIRDTRPRMVNNALTLFYSGLHPGPLHVA